MLNQLNEREKVFVIGGIVFLLFIGIYLIVQRGYQIRSELSDLVVETASQGQDLDRIISDYNYYRALKSGGQDEDVSEMYSKLDQILLRYGLKDKVSSMKDTSNTIRKEYTQVTIDVTLRSVPLTDIIRLIYDIEKNKQINAKVDYLDYRKPFQDKEVYDVSMKISTFKKIGKGG